MFTNLLWKDARQVLPSVAVCLGLAVLGQVLFITRWLRTEDFFELDVPRSLAMVGPMIVALACAGMIFGNERQSRTSHWLSTLPVQWYYSIVSQLAIASLCIVVTAIVTHGIASFAPEVFLDHSHQLLYVSSLSKVILFAGELLLLSIVATLIFEETLYGLCAAGIALLSINALVGYLVDNALNRLGWHSVLSNYDAIFYPLSAVLVGMMLVGSILVYRWRWTLGQFIDCWRSIQQAVCGPWRSEANALAKSNLQRARGIPSDYPNQPFRTLLGQSLRQAPYLRIAVVLAPWVIALPSHPSEYEKLVVMLSMFAFVILGVSCFVTDHSNHRFRFLSDRGVPTWKFFWARTLPLLGIVILMNTAAWTLAGRLSSPEDMSEMSTKDAILFYLIAIVFFFAGQLASLCFRKAVISLGAILATLFGVFCVYLLFESRYSLQGHTIYPLLSVCAAIVFVSIIASLVAYLLLAIFWLVPTWAQTDRPARRLAGGFVVSGILIPIFLLHAVAIAGYWMIPRPTWISQKLSSAELAASKPKSHAVDFILRSKRDLFETCGFANSPLVNDYRPNGSSDDEWFVMNEIHAMKLDDAKVITAIEWITELKEDLDRSFVNLQQSSSEVFEIKWQNLQSLQHYSACIAAMLRLAIQHHESELLEVCFDCLKKMQALNPWIDPVSRIALHRRVLTVFSTCSDYDLKWITQSFTIPPLLDEVVSLVQYRRWVIERSLLVERRSTSDSSELASSLGWEETNRYRWRGTKYGYEPTWYSMLPHAIARGESLYCLAREVRSELELLDHLLEQASSIPNPVLIYDWQSIPQPSYHFGFHLRDLIRYRELEKSVAERYQRNSVR